MKKHCDHECEACIRAEIAKHEKKIQALKKKLPAAQDDLLEIVRCLEERSRKEYIPVPYYPQPSWPYHPNLPIWSQLQSGMSANNLNNFSQYNQNDCSAQ